MWKKSENYTRNRKAPKNGKIEMNAMMYKISSRWLLERFRKRKNLSLTCWKNFLFFNNPSPMFSNQLRRNFLWLLLIDGEGVGTLKKIFFIPFCIKIYFLTFYFECPSPLSRPVTKILLTSKGFSKNIQRHFHLEPQPNMKSSFITKYFFFALSYNFLIQLNIF